MPNGDRYTLTGAYDRLRDLPADFDNAVRRRDETNNVSRDFILYRLYWSQKVLQAA